MTEKIIQALKSHNVFLTGGAGVGKSFTTNEIINHYQKNGKKVAILASTALAANIIGGKTVHSFFGFGVCKDLEQLKAKKTLKNPRHLKDIIEKIDLIIIDEISMLSASVCNMINYRLNQYNFNGKIMLVGDFYQLPPIEKQGDIFNQLYAFESDFWTQLNLISFELENSKRTDDDMFFAALKLIRKANIGKNIIKYLQTFIKKTDLKTLETYTIICATNKEVNTINNERLAQIDSPLLVFSSIFESKKDLDSNEQKLISNWLKSSANYDDLHLKIGARVIFTANAINKDFYNGEQGKLISIEDEKLIVLKDDEELVFVGLHEFLLSQFVPSNDGLKEEVIASLKAYPLKLAYAITIHKSQGMSIDNLVCKIDKIFENGQFYVAISRAKMPKNLIIYYDGFKSFEDFLKNIVKKDKKVSDFYHNLNPIK